MDCQCKVCKSACQKRPGWFAPGEVAKAAAFKGISVEEFFDNFVGVDYYANGDESVFVLAPATERAQPGQEYPFNPHGTCVFYQDGLCTIHPVKPNECRFYDHTTETEVCMENRAKITQQWRENRQEIVKLLGREPELPVPTMLEAMEMVLEDLHHKFGGF